MDLEAQERNSMGALLGALRRRLPLIVVCMIGVAAMAYVLTAREPNRYSASSKLLFSSGGPEQQILGSTQSQPGDQTQGSPTNAELVATRPVAERVARRLGRPYTAGAVLGSVSVAAIKDTSVLRVTATTGAPDSAVAVANVFAQEYVAYRQNTDRGRAARARDFLKRQLKALPLRIRSGQDGVALRNQIQALSVLASLGSNQVRVIEPAERPGAPVSPRPKRNAALGGLFGLLLGCLVALAMEQVNRRLRVVEDVTEAFDLPLLGTLPSSKALLRDASLKDLGPADAEAFRLLYANLRYGNREKPLNAIAITSAAGGEGKTALAWHFAAAAARDGTRVLLVEADTRRPTLGTRYGVRTNPGLGEVIREETQLDDAVASVSVGNPLVDRGASPAMHVLLSQPSGNGSIELTGRRLPSVVAEAVNAYDLVVVDTAPVSLVADAIPLLSQVNGVVVVSFLGRTTRRDAVRLKDQLNKLQAPMLGVAVIGERVRAYGE